ncbi:T-lymphocyte surface antigen Ly-9 [Triplophysa dalaica]|uniref:T-lymphocyte surface antigen Ly-9 n=1 Tax=Triplophysa dalaica TaxID=1582913 RepID=UPI0024DF9AC4|nr:T-lymphocyte surface antigen Ly-9 [Triplophysa dalaica]
MTLRGIALVIYTICIQQAWPGDEHTTGYVGKSVVLKSGEDQSSILTRVQWFIYQNTTYIASLNNGATRTERFWRYKGRLELNNKTGDLTIKNLSMDDSMTYNVKVTISEIRKESKIHLKVQERLKKPNIHQVFNFFKDGQCHIFLRCDLSDENVQLSWTLWDGFSGSYSSGNTNLTESFLWTSFSVNKYATFKCTASSGQQNETQQIKVGCIEETKLKACSSCSCASMVFLGIICTAVVFGLLYASKGKLKATCADGPLHVYQSLFKC